MLYQNVHPLRERLSFKSLKGYVTWPNGSMGSSSLPLLDQSSSCFNAIEAGSMSRYVHGFSFLLTKTQ